ncbi:hypothetical protein pb186bvf_006028 [Paramecium bursaria]
MKQIYFQFILTTSLSERITSNKCQLLSKLNYYILQIIRFMSWGVCLFFICMITLVAFIWYFLHLIGQHYKRNPNDKFADEQIIKDVGHLMGVEQGYSMNPQVEPKYIVGIVEFISEVNHEIQLPQVIYLVLISLLFIILLFIGFVEEPYSYTLNFILGGLLISVMGFYGTQTVNKALINTLLWTDSHEICFTYLYNAGFALSSLLISMPSILYVMTYYFDRENWNKEDKIVGFLMGMIVACLIYRETISIMCRAFKTGSFGLIKTDLNLFKSYQNISQLTRLIYMYSNQAGQIMINYLDAAVVYIFINVCQIQLLKNSNAKDGDNVNQNYLSPVFWFSMNYLFLMVCFFLKTCFKDQETRSFAATNTRWQVIIGAVISFLVFIIFPQITIEKKISIKVDGLDIINIPEVNNIAVSWCCILGIIVNVLHISLYEWYTSHGCPNVRNMSLASVDRVLNMNLIFNSYLGDLFASIPLFAYISLIAICYKILGFLGILYGACGYFSLYLLYGVIYVIGAQSSDSYKLTCFGHFKNNVQSILFQLAWETRNYMIYFKVTNAGTVIMVAISMIGVLLFDTKAVKIEDSKGIFGITIGLTLAYLIKGLNTWAVINLSKDYYSIKKDQNKPINYSEDIRLSDYVKTKLNQSLIYVLCNIVTITLIVLLLGGIFGKDFLIGLLIGFTFGIMIIIFQGLIKGPALENSRIYNEVQEERKDRLYLMYVSGETYGYATEETNACPLLIYLVYTVTLILSVHNRVVKV